VPADVVSLSDVLVTFESNIQSRLAVNQEMALFPHASFKLSCCCSDASGFVVTIGARDCDDERTLSGVAAPTFAPAESHVVPQHQLGPDARIAADFRPAMVFLDIGLPVMDRYELAGRLRDLPQLNRVLLFALTGYGRESDQSKTRDAGFDHHFTKPIDLDAIDAVMACDTSGEHLGK
jgi:CheY-like chemotaxis protein